MFSQVADFEFEVVVGDDCSSDDTRSIILEFDHLYPGKIIKVFHTQNIGMIANQNSVFAACRGKYIAMLEGDDYWTDPCKLQIQVEAMERWPECRMSFHPGLETKRGKRISWYGHREKICSTDEVIIGGGYFCPTPSFMFKREVIESMPNFLVTAPAGDYYLQILGSLGGGALYLPRVMCAYRVGSSGSWSNSVKSLQARQSFRLRTLEAIQLMDKHLNFEFSDAFQCRSNRILSLIAIDYLKEGHLEEFHRYLDKIETQPGEKSRYYSLIRSLRGYPNTLLFMRWCLMLLRKVTRKATFAFESK